MRIGLSSTVVAKTLLIVVPSALGVFTGILISDPFWASMGLICGVFLFFCYWVWSGPNQYRLLMLPFVAVIGVSLILVPVIDYYRGPVAMAALTSGSTSAWRLLFSLLIVFSMTLLIGLMVIGSTLGTQETNNELAASGIAGATIIGLGGLGLIVRFRSVSGVRAFLAGDQQSLAQRQEGILGILAAWFIPLMVPGWIMLKRRARFYGKASLLAVVGVAGIVGLLSFSLNRGTLIVPVLAAAVLWGQRVRKLPTSFWLVGAIMVAFLFLLVGAARGEALGAYNPDASANMFVEFGRQVQIYGQSPYLLARAFPVDQSSYGAQSFIASIMAPLPGIGEAFRAHSGTALYNFGIYGSSHVSDFILPTWLELYMSFGVLGVLLGGLGLASVAVKLAVAASRTTSVLRCFGLLVALIWLSQASIISFSVLVQVIFYQSLPALTLSFIFERSRGGE